MIFKTVANYALPSRFLSVLTQSREYPRIRSSLRSKFDANLERTSLRERIATVKTLVRTALENSIRFSILN